MAKIVVNIEKIEDIKSVLEICPFGAIEEVKGVSDVLRMDQKEHLNLLKKRR